MYRLFLLTFLIGFSTSDENVEYPCPGNDIACVRNYFLDNSCCVISEGPVPDIVIRPDNVEVPFATNNITAVFDYMSYKGIDGKIIAFTINPSTDNAVLAVEFTNITLSTYNADFLFYRTLKEPLKTSDYCIITLKNLIVTAVIPNIKDLQLKDAFYQPYSFDANPCFSLGNKFFTDKDTKDLMKQFLSDVPSAVRHYIHIVSPFAFNMFVKFNICDFRLHLNALH